LKKKQSEGQKFNAYSWAVDSGLSKNTVDNLLRYGTSKIKLENLRKLAETAEEPLPPELSGLSDNRQQVFEIAAPPENKIFGELCESDRSWEARPGHIVVRAPGDPLTSCGLLKGQLCTFDPDGRLYSGGIIFIERADGSACIAVLEDQLANSLVITGNLEISGESVQPYRETIDRKVIKLVAPLVRADFEPRKE
jgi:hypothetical protein